MERKGEKKHCCWGICKLDSRYHEKRLQGTAFIRFPRPGKIKKIHETRQKNQDKAKTEKAKSWQRAFDRVEQITKDTYIYSLHFVGWKNANR